MSVVEKVRVGQSGWCVGNFDGEWSWSAYGPRGASAGTESDRESAERVARAAFAEVA